MALANLRVLKSKKVCARTAVEAERAKFYDPNSWPIAVCNGSYLDVDDVLARSLPEVVAAQVAPVSRRLSLASAKTLTAIPKQRSKGIQQFFHRPRVEGTYALELQEATSE